MGLEKHGSKGGSGYVGGFLQLFDWNGKSRKKLLYNKFDLPESTKQGKISDANLPTEPLDLIEEDENRGVSCAKGSSDYSFVSSSTDDEANGSRAPGVVARLMGLDSLPTSSVSEPYLTPFFESRSLRDPHYLRKTSEFHNEYQNAISNSQPNRVDGFGKRPADLGPQKVPNNPIERFKFESLPLKSAKSHPITHHKLLSPIKSPGFISPKNAADIMEAAAKILEPGFQVSTKGKSLSLGSSSIPIKVCDLKNTGASQRPLKLPETSKRPNESNAVKYLKGQSLNKSWNGSDDIPNFRASPNSEENHSVGSKKRGKSISLAIQAKVNVQRREGLSSSSKSLLVRKEEDEDKSNQSLKSQTAAAKNRQNKLSTSSASTVLRQNNQKQNCPTNKDKLPLKPSVSNQQGRKVVSGDGSLGRNKTFSKVSGISRVGKKEVSEMADLEKEIPSSRTKHFPRKKRAINGDLYSEKNGSINTVLVDRDEKSVQPHVAINEYLNRAENTRRKGMDVVSFTFTSPMVKPTPVSWSSSQMVEKQNTANICFVDYNGEKTGPDAKGKRLSSLGLNVIGGDALSILLEQKLRELTSGVESSSCFNSGKIEMVTTASALNTISASPLEFDKKSLPGYRKDELVGEFNSGCSSINGQVLKLNHKFQGAEGMVESSSSSDAQKELDCQHPSPVSIFEASFSNESCNSSESCESTNGNKMCSSVQAQNLVGVTCTKKILSVEAETELSDSASSTCTETVDTDHSAGLSISGQMRTDEQELEYVREIICNTALIFKDLDLSHSDEVIDPGLFDRLENWKDESRNDRDGKDCKLSRKELFDCVSEFLDIKYSHYIRGGYKTWAQGVAVVRKEGLAEELYKEMLLFRSMGDWMVDELVEKDMSSHLGRWLDFEAEAFEIGVEIEREILCSLVDEAVADIL